jgi:hypothetical protein
MKTNDIFIFMAILMMPLPSFSLEKPSHISPYAGQETREIKTLSDSDITELSNGMGWGLAKAAELNGMPGPVHLLEMKNEIKLSVGQIRDLENLYTKMKNEAIPLGLKFIDLEKELNNRFADNSITDDLLKTLLGNISEVLKKLRYIHLSTHLKTPDILTPEQIEKYNQLRGYTAGDPCHNIPKGHDPQMWKRHHNCP